MSRRNKSVKRPVPPDPRYDSQTVSKFVNNLMYEGKKSVAEGIFYTAMDLIEERTGQPGVSVFKRSSVISTVKLSITATANVRFLLYFGSEQQNSRFWKPRTRASI